LFKKIQSRGRPSLLHGDCTRKNISVLGINISLWVIEKAEKEGLLFLGINISKSLQKTKKSVNMLIGE
jgi:hypothetical protein